MQLLFKNSQIKNRPIKLKNISQQNLLAYFQNTWAIYEWLFSSIKEAKTYYESPDPLRNPLIFYWGHTASFYINKLLLAGVITKGVNPYFEELFAKGVDPDSPENLDKYDLWPSIEEVNTYRKQVKEVVENCINSQVYPLTLDGTQPLWSLLMGIEHDRIHFETSSVLIRQLAVELLKRPIDWEYAPSLGNPPINNIIKVTEGTVIIGRDNDCLIYGWNNEYGRLEKKVAAFEASQDLISNQAYLEFYNTGAYQQEKYWSTEGWQWKQQTNTQHPKFWVPTPDGFDYRAMFDNLPMPLDYPVEVNAHEAWAYCNWKGDGWRLLSESEFHRIGHSELKNGDCAFQDTYNLNLKYGSPNPVGSLNNSSSLGFNDLFGNVWDWLSDDFYPLPSFEPHKLYADFSEPYFDSEHSMLLGGAWATTGTGASKHYRLWFRRHFYQHAGFRIARSLK